MRGLSTAHIAADFPGLAAAGHAARLQREKVSAKTTRKTTTGKTV